jgi:2-succinyl-6-hydroxy-2,4-cyclohexadiene-1-carboxylate synthase
MTSFQWNYKISGAPGNTPLLFLHGFMGSLWDWQDIISRLDQNFFCLAVDLPGHGETRVHGDNRLFEIEQTAIGIIDLLADLQLEKTNLIGYSMGGRLALYLAVNFRNRFTRVVVESASPGLDSQQERRARKLKDQQLAATLGSNNFHNFIENWYRQQLFQSLRSHPKFPELLERRYQNNPEGLANSLRFLGTGSQPSLWSRLRDIDLSVLILVGEKDKKFRKIALRMSELIPRSEIQIVNKCGHNLHFENHIAFIRHLQKFLA